MFQKFVTNEFSQLKAEDVLDNFSKYKKDIEKTCSDIEVIAVLAKSVVKEANTRSAKTLKDKQKDNLKSFFMLLPSDVASDVWVGLLRGTKTKRFVVEWQSDKDFEEKLKEVYLA